MPTAQGFYRFEHKYYSRKGNKTHGPSGYRHLSAKSNYMTNLNKVLHADDFISINLSNDRHELYSELMEHSNSVKRANGHIAEDFIISFDKRMSDEDQREALGNFMMAVSFDERIKVTATIHHDDQNNPHAHVLVIDRDANGEPVAHFSRSGADRRKLDAPIKGNVTKWLRKQWEEDCNAVLEERGYDFRVDCRTNLERGLAEAQKPKGWEKSQAEKAAKAVEPIPELEPSALECPPMPGADDLEATLPDGYVEELSAPAEEAEDDMETGVRYTPREAVHVALDFNTELRELRMLRAKFQGYTEALESAAQHLETAQDQATEAFNARSTAEKAVDTAKRELKAYQDEKEQLLGKHVKLGIGKWTIFEWKSALRKEGEQALAAFEKLNDDLEFAERDEREANLQVQRHESSVKTHTETVAHLKNEIDEHLAKYGKDATLERAEATLSHTAHSYLADVSLDELQDLFEARLISTTQYRDALELKGATAQLKELDEYLEEEMEEDNIEEV